MEENRNLELKLDLDSNLVNTTSFSIDDIKKVVDLQFGDNIECLYALIEQVDKKHTKNKEAYLDITLQDKTGAIKARKWNATEEEIKTFTNGNIVKIGGVVSKFRDALQITVRQIELSNSMDIDHFLPSAPIKKIDLIEDIRKYILSIMSSNYRRIVNHLLKKFENEFFDYPAASKNHHEYVSGLAHHVKSMLDLGESLCNLYPSLNKDLLLSGIILHDIGKVKELSGNISTEYTTEGKLLGHITIGVIEIQTAANELKIDGEEVMLLQHLLLSHHGKLEYGSPKLPMLREAEALSFIDILDSRMTMVDKELSEVEEGTFSKRVFALDHRSFYNPTSK